MWIIYILSANIGARYGTWSCLGRIHFDTFQRNLWIQYTIHWVTFPQVEHVKPTIPWIEREYAHDKKEIQ